MVNIGDDRSLHLMCLSLIPDSTSFIISDQSGLLRGRILSFSMTCFCLSVIGFFSNSGGGASPGGGGGGGGAPMLGGGGGGGGAVFDAAAGFGSGVFAGDGIFGLSDASFVFFNAGLIMGVGVFDCEVGVVLLAERVFDFSVTVFDFVAVGVGDFELVADFELAGSFKFCVDAMDIKKILSLLFNIKPKLFSICIFNFYKPRENV